MSDEAMTHARRYESNVEDDKTRMQRQLAAEFNHSAGVAADPVIGYMKQTDLEKAIDNLKAQMIAAAKRMDFVEAAQYRDEIFKLQQRLQPKQ